MSQARRHSLIEAVTNTVVGLLVTLGAQLVVYPLYLRGKCADYGHFHGAFRGPLLHPSSTV